MPLLSSDSLHSSSQILSVQYDLTGSRAGSNNALDLRPMHMVKCSHRAGDGVVRTCLSDSPQQSRFPSAPPPQLGALHGHTQACAYALVALLQQQGRTADAAALLQEMRDSSGGRAAAVLAADAPAALSPATSLAGVLYRFRI